MPGYSHAWTKPRAPVTQTPRGKIRFNRDHPLADRCWGAWALWEGNGAEPHRNLVGDWAQSNPLVGTGGTGYSSRGTTALPHGMGWYQNLQGDFSGLSFGTYQLGQHGWLNAMAGDPSVGSYASATAASNTLKGTLHLVYFGRGQASGQQYLFVDGPGNSILIRKDILAGGGNVNGGGYSSHNWSSNAKGDDRLSSFTLSLDVINKPGYVLDNDEWISLGNRGGISFNGGQLKMGYNASAWRGGAYFVAVWAGRNLGEPECRELNDPERPWPLIEEYGLVRHFDFGATVAAPPAGGGRYQMLI